MPDFRSTSKLALGVLMPALWMLMPNASAQDAYPVAGLAPDMRPRGAPVVRVFEPGPDWRNKALAGVIEPYPPSIVGFLDSQGAWYSPFAYPGMTGPYDLRGWHAKRNEGKP